MIETYAGKLNLSVAPGSIDERLIGRTMLKAVAESLDGAAARFRREILPYLPDTDAERMRQEMEILDELEATVGKLDPQPWQSTGQEQSRPPRNDFQIQVMERSLLHSDGTLQPLAVALAEFPDATV